MHRRSYNINTILKAAQKLRFPAAEIWLDILCLGNVKGSLNRDLSEVVGDFKTTFRSTEVGKAVKTQMRAAILQKKQAEFSKLCAISPRLRNWFTAVKDLLGQEGVKKHRLKEDYFMEDGSLSDESRRLERCCMCAFFPFLCYCVLRGWSICNRGGNRVEGVIKGGFF